MYCVHAAFSAAVSQKTYRIITKQEDILSELFYAGMMSVSLTEETEVLSPSHDPENCVRANVRGSVLYCVLQYRAQSYDNHAQFSQVGRPSRIVG